MPAPSSNSVPVSGHCDPRFQAVRDVFEKNLREGLDLGAAVAFSLDGEPVVDLWATLCKSMPVDWAV